VGISPPIVELIISSFNWVRHINIHSIEQLFMKREQCLLNSLDIRNQLEESECIADIC